MKNLFHHCIPTSLDRVLKTLLGLGLVLLFCPVTSALSQSVVPENEEEIILHLKWKHAFQFAGFYAAQTQGFYADNGLNVVIRESGKDGTALEAVLAGRSNFGIWGANLLNQRLTGKPLVVLGVIFQHSPLAVISLQDTGIRIPADLVGKTVAVGSKVATTQLDAMLIHEGLSPSSVNLVSHTRIITDLLEKKIDAEFSYVTDQPNQIRMLGEQPSVLLPINYGIDFYGDCLFTSEKEIQNHPERVKAFRQASFQGWEYAMSHVDELIEYVLTLPGARQRGLTRNHLEYEAEQMQRLLQPDLVQPGHMNPGRWRRMADMQVELGLIGADYSLDGFLYDPDSPMSKTWLWLLMVCLAFVGLIAGIVIFWNFQMRRVITQRTADLHQSEQRLRILFETAPVSLWLEDFTKVKARFKELKALGITDFREHFLQHPEEITLLSRLVRLVDVNQESINLHRATSKEHLLTSWPQTFTKESLPVFCEEMITFAEGADRFESDALVQTLDGKKIHVFARMVIGGENNDWSRVYLALVDISERKKAEENNLEIERQIQHGQKLESLGILAGGIAHDFNNLLMAILGNTDLALEDLAETSPARNYLNRIHTTSRRAADLCQQMLAYSGRGRFEIKVFDLNELTREMSHLLKTIIPKKVALKKDLPLPGPTIRADISQIQQVIMNLITNASEAIGSAVGTITLSTAIRDCDAACLQKSRLTPPLHPGKYASLMVTDDGEGMEEETLNKLFDPFFTTKFTGRGLGLSAVLGIIRGHSGAIIVDSRKGHGTTFTVLFPLVEQSAPSLLDNRQDTLFSSPWQGKGVVLLADDEESVRDVACRMLEIMGFEVMTASDGLQAVDVFRENPDTIDFVIMDLTMPQLSGEEAFKRIREIRPQVPIMMVSGYSQEELAFQFGDLGAAGFIQKPFTLDRFRSEIRRFIDKTSS